MIRFRALGVRFSLPLLTLIVPLLARRLGMRGMGAELMLALGVHEGAHLLAARLCRVEILEIRLMPFGGSARMENPYRLSPAQLIPVALAGPAANLLLACAVSALAQWRLISAAAAGAHAAINLALMLFNLAPVLPLDGGRVLCAVLSRFLGEHRALSVGLLLGRLCAAGLCVGFIAAGLAMGIWNISLPLAAVFLLCAAPDEQHALTDAHAQRLEAALTRQDRPMPARLYQLSADSTVAEAVRLLRPRERSWFLCMRGDAPDGVIDGGSLLRYLVSGGAPDTPLHSLPRSRFIMAKCAQNAADLA